MRHNDLFFKAILTIAVSAMSLTTACSAKINPNIAKPAPISTVSTTVADIVNSYKNEDFSVEKAEDTINDLSFVVNKLGYTIEQATIVRVVDGDTLVVDYNGEEVKVRLTGINTPESVASQEYLDKTGKQNTQEGKDASDWVKNLLKDYNTVYLQKDVSDTDKYDRKLRYVWLEMPNDVKDINEIRTKMLNGVLLDQGLAEVSIYKPDVEYADEFQAIYTHTTDTFENDNDIEIE